MSRWIVPGIALIACVGAFVAWQRGEAPPGPAPAALPAGNARLPPLQPASRQVQPAQAPALSDADRRVAQELRQRFAAHLGKAHGRVRMLEQLLAYLESAGAAGDLARAWALLAEMFPERAPELFELLQRVLDYHGWLRAQREALVRLPPGERRQALWQARHAAFGELAEEIWAAERRTEQIRTELAALDRDDGRSPQEKLAAYVEGVGRAWGEDAPLLIESRQTELLTSFLELGTVQDALRQQAPAERAATLRELRAGLGMDAEALARWQVLDAERDRAWAAGEAYWAQRQQLLAQASGAELQRRLRELQDQAFGAEAEIIRSEEAAGFYRFARARRYGME